MRCVSPAVFDLPPDLLALTMTFSAWLTFALATLAISVSPGPGAVAAMGAGLSHGFARGQSIALGLALGVWTQLVGVGLGLGVLLSASSRAFAALQLLGAAYLIWLGVQQWRTSASPLAVREGVTPAAGRRQLLLRGWGVNALNPKGTVFLLAMLPQFVNPAQPQLPQYLIIGATFGVIECAVMSSYVALAARAVNLLRAPGRIRGLNRLLGALLIVAGVVLGWMHPRA